MTYTLEELADCSGATLHGDGACSVTGVASLESAQEGQISFLTSIQYRKYLAATRASAVILREEDLSACDTNALVSDNPYLAYARVAARFAPPPQAVPGVPPLASVAATAMLKQQHVNVRRGYTLGLAWLLRPRWQHRHRCMPEP